ncbi:MAG: DUF3237 domain-containing protein [Proteobacteria bacterium]|nr:DUF3237 domain-containing protein [Pseudomonadota bacterium]
MAALYEDESILEALSSPAELLELLGLIELLGLDALRDTTRAPERVLHRWLKQRLTARGGAAPFVHQDPRASANSLLDLAAELVLRDLDDVLDRDGWVELLAAVDRPDVARARQALQSGGEEALGEALTALSPRPDVHFEGWVSLGVLAPLPSGNFEIRPAWARTLLRREALRRLCERDTDTVGALLLCADVAAEVVDRLCERAAGGEHGLVQAAVDGLDLTRPASVAMLEAAFLASGQALADGKSLPLSLVEAVWRAQERVLALADEDAWPCPTFEWEAGDGGPRRLEPTARWRLAGLFLSDRLVRAEREVSGSVLNPWPRPGSETPAEPSFPLWTLSWTSGGWLRPPPWLEADALRLSRLGAKAWAAFGPKVEIRWAAPEILACLAGGAEVELESGADWRTVAELELGAEALWDACGRRGVDPASALAAWWIAVGRTNPGSVESPDGFTAPELLATLPADAVNDFVAVAVSRLLHHDPTEAAAISRSAWSPLLAQWASGRSFDVAALAEAPSDLLLDHLLGDNRVRGVPRLSEAVWRDPRKTLTRLGQLSGEEPGAQGRKWNRVWELLAAVPDEAAPDLLAEATSWLTATTPARLFGRTVRRWLRSRARLRHPGWEQAWALYVKTAEPPD